MPVRLGGRPWARGALAVAAAALLAACTVDPVTSSSSGSASGSAELPEPPYRIAMITHGDNGGFWSVVRRGATDAAEQLDVTLDYQGSAGDARLQSQMIQAALIAGAQGLAVSAPDVGAIRGDLDRAAAAGVPIVTLNSGAELATEQEGVITHVGQSEFLAGEGAGAELARAGYTTVMCVIHENNNIGLQERCDGAAKGLADANDGTLRKVLVTGKADPGSTSREVGAAISSQSPDAVLTLDGDIAAAVVKPVSDAGLPLATFDVSPDVLAAIRNDQIIFAVDQQPYLQGYLPISFLELAIRNRNEVGAGDIVLTGPSFVTKDNVDEVAALAEQGTR